MDDAPAVSVKPKDSNSNDFTGPVKHKETDPPESQGMQYLKRIFDFILAEAAAKLADLNTQAGQAGYGAAVTAYNNFLDELNDQAPTTLGVTMNWIVIEPVMSAGGLIVGARVIVRWLGGTHSSSSGVAIKHP